MRSICLIALFVESVMLVLADLASGVITASIPGADQGEHADVGEYIRTAFVRGNQQEERASTYKDVLAKMPELAMEKAGKYASLIESTAARFVGWNRDAGVIAREHHGDVARVADADGHQIISTTSHLGHDDVHFTKGVTQLHTDRDYEKAIKYLEESLKGDNYIDKLELLVKTEGSDLKAAQVIHKSTQEKSPDDVEWDNLEAAQYLKWFMGKKNPADVVKLLVGDDGKGTEAIAREIAKRYEEYVRK